MSQKFYAGIGSRKGAGKVENRAIRLAARLTRLDYTLISGGAEGMDEFFERGAGDNKIILKNSDCTSTARIISAMFHPAWHNCKESGKQLLGRNSMIILNKDLITPVDFVLCWTTNESYGGTSLGIRIARAYGIPVFNLYNCTNDDFWRWFKSDCLRGERYEV